MKTCRFQVPEFRYQLAENVQDLQNSLLKKYASSRVQISACRKRTGCEKQLAENVRKFQ